MNTVVTSREEILKGSRFLAASQGLDRIGIRTVAAHCGISVGSVYNYFPSKSALMLATVESIWQEIFTAMEEKDICGDICRMVSWLYDCLDYGRQQYPGFMENHASAFTLQERKEGFPVMEKTMAHMEQKICRTLQSDPRIRQDAFCGGFTPEAFSRLLFSLVFCTAGRAQVPRETVLETVRRTLF